MGQAEGAELDEDELLGRLREKELITYPSSLLSFLEEYPDLFKDEVLPRLDSTDIAVFAQVGPPLLAAVVASDLPCAGTRTVMRHMNTAERDALARAVRAYTRPLLSST